MSTTPDVCFNFLFLVRHNNRITFAFRGRKHLEMFATLRSILAGAAVVAGGRCIPTGGAVGTTGRGRLRRSGRLSSFGRLPATTRASDKSDEQRGCNENSKRMRQQCEVQGGRLKPHSRHAPNARKTFTHEQDKTTLMAGRDHLKVPLSPKLREVLRQRPTKEELKAIRVTILDNHDTSTASFKHPQSRLYIIEICVNAAGQAFDS
jgi:hypothetical protein